MVAKTVKVEIHTRDFRVVGTVYTPAESYRSRLSDRLNEGSPNFIPVTNAEVWAKQSGKITTARPRKVECIIINVQSIEATIPLEE